MTTEEQTVNSTPDDDTPIGRVGFGLFEPATRANPYPVYHRLREQAPIYHSPAGIHIFSRYADAAAILCDPRFGYSEPRAPLGRALLTEHDRTGLLRDDHGKSVSSFLTRNPPDHNRLRRFVAPSFTPRAVARWRRASPPSPTHCWTRHWRRARSISSNRSPTHCLSP